MMVYFAILVCMTLTMTECSTANADAGFLNTIDLFGTNETNEIQVFLRDDDSLILGTKNSVLNISLETLEETRRITWAPSTEDETLCKKRGGTMEQCHNYIKLLTKRTYDELLVCGTNGLKPSCHTYRTNLNETLLVNADTGIGIVPYDSMYKSTGLYAGDQLFSATNVDPSGQVPVIYTKSNKTLLRTAPLNPDWLNNARFVSTFQDSDKVYFVFREYVQNIDREPFIVSRLASVCKNDRGYNKKFWTPSGYYKHIWTSFFKARLNCSIPGQTPVYIDEVQSTTELGKGNYMPSSLYSGRTDMFYAIFHHTPKSGIQASAVCAFRLQDITRSFAGFFGKPDTFNSKFVPHLKVPTPHPAEKCANDSRILPKKTVKFIVTHPLMYQSIPAYGGSPIITHFGMDYQMSTIAVDWQFKASDDKYYDVLFIGTNNGCVIKAMNKGTGAIVEPHVIENVQVFTDESPVTNIQIYRKGATQKLIVAAGRKIKSMPLARCHIPVTCKNCLKLRDPYCSWNEETNQCTESQLGIQNLVTGHHNDIIRLLCNRCRGSVNSEGEQQHFSGEYTSTSIHGLIEHPTVPKHTTSCNEGYTLLAMIVVGLGSFTSATLLAFLWICIPCKRTANTTAFMDSAVQ